MNSALPTAGVTTSVAAPPATTVTPRLDCVDLLRGLVMVVMALDHTRDFYHWSAIQGHDPLDLAHTSPPLFFTRWITHFCAPIFLFLAGTGAFLSSTRGKSPAQLSWFLATRGLWLVVLELTFIKWFGWNFGLDLTQYVAAVIWVIGWSMIVLAGLVHLPLAAIATFGLALIVGHNATDGLKPEDFGRFADVWRVLHAGGPVALPGNFGLFIFYPLVPWVGVMAAGYAFGTVLLRAPEERQRWMFRAGVLLLLAFVALRVTNLYGNPTPWVEQARPGFDLLAILRCQKYPPSLAYLLMTLGPAMILLAVFDRFALPRLQWLKAFGRVPMFYYLLHLPLIHGSALLFETIRGHDTHWMFHWMVRRSVDNPPPPDAGIALPGVYLVWMLVIVLLYPLCRWFCDVKRRRRDAWLSYF